MKRLLASCLVLLLFITVLPLNLASSSQSNGPQPTYIREDSNFIYIGNQFTELQFDKASNGGIYSVINNLTGDDYRSNKNSTPSLFLIGVDSNYPNSTSFDNKMASVFDYNYTASGAASTLQLVDSFTAPYPAIVTVRVTVYQNSSLTHWSLRVRNQGSRAIDNIVFPTIEGVEKAGALPSADYLLIPDDFGSMLVDPYDNFVMNPNDTGCFGTGIYPSFHATTQVILFGDQAGGLYMSAYDAAGYSKSFGACKDRLGTSWTENLFIAHELPEVASADLSLPYDLIIGTYTGDWHRGADIYREWALKQPWTSQGPLYLRNDVPAWFKNGFAVLKLPSYISSGDYADPTVASSFSGIVANVRNYLHGANSPLILDWWGWEKYGTWVAPDVFPPREGWASFENTVSELHAMGVHVVVSMSGGPLMTNAPGFDSKWLSCAIRNSDGSIFTITDSGKVVAWASPSCPMFQDWLVNATVTLAKVGVDGVRFDANYGYNFDFSSNSGHAPGYGDWYAQSWIALLTRVRSAVFQINQDFLLGGEHLPEIYMPFNQVYEAEGGAIGSNANLLQFGSHLISTNLFSYLYNEYAKCLSEETHVAAGVYPGTYAYFQYRQAVEATSGEVVDVAAGDVGFQQYLPVTNQTRGTVWASAAFAGDFVVQGRELPPPQLNVPMMNITVGLSFNPALVRYQTPQVLAGAWQAPDGRIAIILVNLGNTTSSLPVGMGGYYSMLPANGTYSLAMFNENGFRTQPLGPTSTAQVNLPALGSVTVELALTSAIPTIYQRYASFMLSYPGKTLVDNAASFGMSEGVRTAAMTDAEQLFQAQSYPSSISEALRALNGTVGDFERFGQLISNTTEYHTLISLAEKNLTASNYLAVVSNLNLAEGLALKGLEPRFMNVLFDEGHSDEATLSPQIAATLSPSAPENALFTNLAEDLSSLGYQVSSNRGLLTDSLLSRYQVLIICSPTKPFAPSEVSSILRFVRNGGGLFFMAADWSPEPGNDVTTSFGIRIINDYITTQPGTGNLLAADFLVTNITQNNPITKGVGPLYANIAAPMQVLNGSEADVLAWTDRDTYSTNTPNSSPSPTVQGPFPYLISEQYGSGRVIIFADNFFENPIYTIPSSVTLAHNTLFWLDNSLNRTLLVDALSHTIARVDVGSAQDVAFHLVSAGTGLPSAGATVTANGTSARANSSGWATLAFTSSKPGSLTVSSLEASDSNGTLRVLYAVPPAGVTLVWDRIDIILSGNSPCTVGSNATITWTGYYEYDHTPFTGKLTLNDTTTKDTPGTYAYTVSSIADQKYGLTVFTSNSVSITFVQQETSTTSTSTTSITSLSTTSSSTNTSSLSNILEGLPSYLPAVAVLAILAVVTVALVFSRRRRKQSSLR